MDGVRRKNDEIGYFPSIRVIQISLTHLNKKT